MLTYLKKINRGITRNDLTEHSYETKTFLSNLVKEKKVLIIKNNKEEADSDIIVYRNPIDLTIDDDIKKLWISCKLPSDINDLRKQLSNQSTQVSHTSEIIK